MINEKEFNNMLDNYEVTYKDMHELREDCGEGLEIEFKGDEVNLQNWLMDFFLEIHTPEEAELLLNYMNVVRWFTDLISSGSYTVATLQDAPNVYMVVCEN